MSIEHDSINHPSHYNQGDIECIDAIYAATGDGAEHYLQGNIIKYMWRYKHRKGIQDLKKAQWYLNAMIELLEKRQNSDTSGAMYAFIPTSKKL